MNFDSTRIYQYIFFDSSRSLLPTNAILFFAVSSAAANISARFVQNIPPPNYWMELTFFIFLLAFCHENLA